MKSARSHLASHLLAAIAVGVCAFAAPAQTVDQTTIPAPQKPGLQQPPEPKVPREQEGLDVVEQVGSRLPMNLAFTDSLGTKVTLADYFTSDTRPAIIVMGYYRCPIVCGVIREKLVQSLAGVDNVMGKDFRVLTFSIAPDEAPQAAEKARVFDHAFYAPHPSSAASDAA